MIHLLHFATFHSASQSVTHPISMIVKNQIVKNQNHRIRFVPRQVAANCIVFIHHQMWVANWELAPLDETPMIGPLPADLADSGGRTTHLLTCEQLWWCLFTSTLPSSLFVRSPVLPLEGFSAFVVHTVKIVTCCSSVECIMPPSSHHVGPNEIFTAYAHHVFSVHSRWVASPRHEHDGPELGSETSH